MNDIATDLHPHFIISFLKGEVLRKSGFKYLTLMSFLYETVLIRFAGPIAPPVPVTQTCSPRRAEEQCWRGEVGEAFLSASLIKTGGKKERLCVFFLFLQRLERGVVVASLYGDRRCPVF